MSTREQADSVSQSRKAFKGLGGGGGDFTKCLISHPLLLDVDQVDGYLCF